MNLINELFKWDNKSVLNILTGKDLANIKAVHTQVKQEYEKNSQKMMRFRNTKRYALREKELHRLDVRARKLLQLWDANPCPIPNKSNAYCTECTGYYTKTYQNVECEPCYKRAISCPIKKTSQKGLTNNTL